MRSLISIIDSRFRQPLAIKSKLRIDSKMSISQSRSFRSLNRRQRQRHRRRKLATAILNTSNTICWLHLNTICQNSSRQGFWRTKSFRPADDHRTQIFPLPHRKFCSFSRCSLFQESTNHELGHWSGPPSLACSSHWWRPQVTTLYSTKSWTASAHKLRRWPLSAATFYPARGRAGSSAMERRALQEWGRRCGPQRRGIPRHTHTRAGSHGRRQGDATTVSISSTCVCVCVCGAPLHLLNTTTSLVED